MPHPDHVLLDRIAAAVQELHGDALTLSRAMTPGSRPAIDALIGNLGALIVSINAQRGPNHDALVALRHATTALTHLVHAAEHLTERDGRAHDALTALRQVQSAARCLRLGHTDLLRARSRRPGAGAPDLRAAA